MLTTRLDISRLRSSPARRPTASQFAPSDPPLGQLGPWRLVSLLSRGAWSRVYRARPADCPADHPADYVVKVADVNGKQARQARAMLRREAQVGRQVSHPHLSPILAADLDSATSYVVRPRIDGVTLAAALASGTSPTLPHALWIARQTAEALASLHAHGWLHGDVKPGNIMISAKGHATLIDLGFAQRIGVPRGGSCQLLEASTNQRVNSEAGSFRHGSERSLQGTLAYAAPELFTEHVPCSPQSDVYSLGITLYEMLTGRLPFLATDPTDLAVAHLREIPPDPRSFQPHLPVRAGWLLHRLLAKEPLRRPNAEELVSLLVELEVEAFSERP